MDAFKSLNVEMTPEHFKRVITGAPINAIAELIWNSLDADAKNVEVRFSYHGLDGAENPSEIVVKDDGHGIAYDKVEEYFGKYGRSQKTDSRKSPAGRTYHGKLGEGRYKAFSIGSIIEWNTIYEENGEHYTYTIRLDSSSQMRIQYSDAPIKHEQKKTGTEVRIVGIQEENMQRVGALQKNTEVVPKLLALFAPYLNAYSGITIDYNGTIIDPKDYIDDQSTKTIVHQGKDGKEYSANILIIKWKNAVSGQIYICGQTGVVYDEIENGIGQQKSLSVYAASSYFEEMHQANTLAWGEGDPVFDHFMKETRKAVKEYLKTIDEAEAAKEINAIKEEGAYPYKADPQSEVEKAERGMFDVVAVEINRVVPQLRKTSVPTKKLTYRLIKEAINTNPSNLKKILEEVFNLTVEQQNTFAELLEHSRLPNIIDTAKAVADRLEFIYLLEEMVYNDSVGKAIKERTQFHKLLLKNLWVFGDQYQLGTTDQSLKNVLKAHIQRLGRDELIPNIPPEATEDLTRIPDICLFQQICHANESYEHLVIELKRPCKTLTKTEIDQIEDYAFTVRDNPLFDKSCTKWHFILLGQDFDQYVINRLNNDTKGKGNLQNDQTNHFSISVFRWNEIISQLKFKYEFLRRKLNLELSDDPDFAKKTLMEKHEELFPNSTWSKKENN